MENIGFVGITLKEKYFIKKLIGEGRMANVYLAWDKIRTTEMAIKILRSDLASDSRFLSMFKEESKFMRKLGHPNIVRSYDSGIDNVQGEKIAFIAMEYKKCDLKNLIEKRKKPLEIQETANVVNAICKALHFAHQSNVLHCDVKPANILLAQDEKKNILEKDVFLADFGISRWALEKQGGGTPAYMAPELFQGGSVSQKTEVYAVGVTLYEMLSGGVLPFKGDTSSPGSKPRDRIAWEKSNTSPPPLQKLNPGLSISVIYVIDKAMNKDVRFRYSNMLELLSEFENAKKKDFSPQEADQKTILQPINHDSSTRFPTIPSSDKIHTTKHPHLLGINGEKTGQKILIFSDGLTVGRQKNNQLQLIDRSVSRVHARIIRTRRAFYIIDQKSTHGTYINGQRIYPEKHVLLRNGDRIEIGDSQIFEFHIK